jgi:hypothetical protein
MVRDGLFHLLHYVRGFRRFNAKTRNRLTAIVTLFAGALQFGHHDGHLTSETRYKEHAIKSM